MLDRTFCFTFPKPRTHQVWTRTWLTDGIRQFFNCKNVELYNKYLVDVIDDNKLDDSSSKKKRAIILNDFIQSLLKSNDQTLQSKQVAKKIFNEKENNVVLLNSNVYPGVRKKTNE